MQPGDNIADRFELLEHVGSGGMGTVYRALDRESGAPVAVKLLSQLGPGAHARFQREARVLATLHHPRIVRHIDSGVTDDGHPYLAMDWLEGEDLAARLERAPLSIGDSLLTVRAACEALATAHAAGVIHRDVKPSNLFLVGGEPSQAVVLDFGIARALEDGRSLTRTGTTLGTAGYMAPEQLRSARDVDARADVFALGCVLFECLTGAPAFTGAHPLALIAKLLVEEIPRISELRPELPAALDSLVARAMAKDPAARPADARALLDELASIEAAPEPTPSAHPTRGLRTSAERHLVAVLLVAPPRVDSDATLTPSELDTELVAVSRVAARFGAEVSVIGAAGLLVVMGGTGAATDLAARAASCALGVIDELPSARIVLVTGRAQIGRATVVGPAIEVAAELLERADAPGVWLDEVTDGLLDARFVRSEGRLLAEQEGELAVRRLLGRPTPFVGRTKELRLLEATLDECVEERVSQAVVITAPAGMGKSRLRHELVRYAHEVGARVLSARADPVGSGSALALARQLVRAGDAPSRVAALGGFDDPDRTTGSLRELAGESDASAEALRATRAETLSMTQWLERAFVEWLGREAQACPVVVVLEDLHWGDRPTVGYVDRLLRDRPDVPLLVVATARPEVHAVFGPTVWSSARVQVLPLSTISAAAASKLIYSVLPSIEPALAARIVELAQGNAFFLEELIRHAAGGRGDLPQTVLAMMETRLGALEPEARLILRAASVFGDRFWDAGVRALVDAEVDVEGWLERLGDAELVEPVEPSRVPGAAELSFRHALVREAAYASAPDADLRAAHLMAGEWLERAAERDSRVLMDHFARAERWDRAAVCAIAAAEAAMDGSDADAAITLAQHALDWGAEGVDRARALLVRGVGAGYRSRWELTLEAQEAITLLPIGSARWNLAVAATLYGALSSARGDIAAPMVALLATTDSVTEPTSAYGFAILLGTLGLLAVGQGEASRALVARLSEASARADDPTVDGWLQACRGWTALALDRDLGEAARCAARASAVFRERGHYLGDMIVEMISMYVLLDTGRLDAASALADRDASGFEEFAAHSAIVRMEIALERGSSEHVRELGERLLASTAPQYIAHGAALLARHEMRAQRFDAAREWLEKARPMIAGAAWARPPYYADSAELALLTGDPEQALRYAELGLASAVDGPCYPSPWLRLALLRAHAIEAAGGDATAATRDAYERLVWARDHLPAELREQFLEGRAHHREIARRARVANLTA